MDMATEEKDGNAAYLKIISHSKATASSEHNGIARHRQLQIHSVYFQAGIGKKFTKKSKCVITAVSTDIKHPINHVFLFSSIH